MDISQESKNAYQHEELKEELTHYSERFGCATSTTNAHLWEARVKKEDVVVTIESSDDDADEPSPSATRSGPTAANGTDHVGSPRLPLATITPNANGRYPCQDCRKTFATRDSLELHVAKPHSFACNVCESDFKFKAITDKQLKKHAKRCFKRWLRLSSMPTEPKKLWENKRERKKRRGVDASLLAGLQTCWRCSSVFRDKQSLDEHIRDSHHDGIRNPPPQSVDFQQEPQASGSAPDVIWLD